ncbi:hypothetical protein UlMin_037997 [Ulmus minor]
MVEDVVIVGAGIAGLATALALRRVGIKALVLERSDELRATGAALALFPNAWLALEALGVSHKLTSIYSPASRGFITNLSNGAIRELQPSGATREGIVTRAVHRKALLNALAEELPTDSIRFSSKITAIETEEHEGSSSIAVIHVQDGTVIKAKALIGCDGVRSMVANWLGLAEPVSSGRSSARGLAVYPQGHGLQKDVHQFVGLGRRAGFVPLNDKEIYWFFTCASPAKGANLPTDPKEIQKDLIENYAKDLPEMYLEVVKHCDLSTLTWATLMLRLPWKVAFGKLSKQTITVAGDAMHPMTPDLAQGGCSALEDAVVLARHIGTSYIQNGGLFPREMAKAIENYAEERKWRAAWLIAGSFLSGWVQSGGSHSLWGLRLFRDIIFYKFILTRIVDFMHYDCGKLPSVQGFGELDKNK